MKLTESRIAIVTHVQMTGALHELLKHLLDGGTRSVLFITHPLSYVADSPGPEVRLYEGGNLVQASKLPNQKLPALMLYVRDTVLTLFWVFRTRGQWDLMVAADNLNAAAALILRRLGKVRRVVYYTIDFTPQRFGNSILNDLYHRLDALCVRKADVTWNISPRIAEGRREIRGLRGAEYDRQVVAPFGVWFDQQKRHEFDDIERHALIYTGGLLPHQGLDLVIEAMVLIVARVPDTILRITGFGPLEGELKDRSETLGMSSHIQFLGYIEDPEERDDIVAKSAIGVAMYNQALDRWSYYADPSKIKMYLGAGLPVVTTSLTHLAEDLRRRRAGMVVPYEKQAFAEAVVDLLLNDEMYREYRSNAIHLASEFDWRRIFDSALNDPRLEVEG